MFRSACAFASCAGALAATFALAPAAARAEVRYVYDGQLSVDLSYATSELNDTGEVTRSTTARFHVYGWLLDMTFVDGRLLTQGVVSHARIENARVDSHYVNRGADPVHVVDCTATAGRAIVPGVANPLQAIDRSAAPTAIGVTPIAMAGFDLACGEEGPGLLGLGTRAHGVGDLGPAHLRDEVTVPAAQLGEERIRLALGSSNASLRHCPGDYVESDLRSCSTSLRGMLTLIRKWPRQVDADRDELLAPPSRPKLDRTAGRARSTARCPRGCAWRIRIFLPPRRGRGRFEPRSATASAAGLGGAKLIAHASGRLPAGNAARTITATIPPARRAAVLAAGGAFVQVALDPPRGRAVATTTFAPTRG
jgi:hypothetical protein